MNDTLITGATRGIGRGLFEAALKAGEPVIGTCRSHPPEDLAAHGDWQALDLACPDGPAALGARLSGRPISILWCNAGVYPDKGQRLDGGFPAAMWAETFAVNVTGMFLTIQALLPNLRAAENPRIGIIASAMGSQAKAPGGSYIYRASKAAAVNIGRNLAADLAGEGIAVGVYHPGWVRTDMGGRAAAISLEESVAGLRTRIDELGLSTSGCFEAWDGTTVSF